ncbi:MAG: hypothetical protein ACE5HV_05910, partial [Acidobacteriota bacterium]
MGTKRPLVGAVLLAFVASPVPLVTQRVDLDKIVAAYEATVATTRSFRARVLFFEQSPFSSWGLTREGMLSYLAPDRWRLALTKPSRTTAIVDGNLVRVLPDSEGTRRLQELPLVAWAEGDVLLALQLVSMSNLRDLFEVSLDSSIMVATVGAPVHRLVLRPRQATEVAERWAALTLQLVEGEWFPSDLELQYHNGDKKEVRLSAIARNATLSEQDFELLPPAGEAVEEPAAEVTPPGPPMNLILALERPGSYPPEGRLFWNAPTGSPAPSSYILEVGWFPGVANRAQIDIGNATTSYELPYLSSGVYYLRVRAKNAAGVSASSNEVRLDARDSKIEMLVADPAYAADGPIVGYDEAHNNFLTASEGAAPFMRLIQNDGYRVSTNREPFSPEVLSGYDILVIANAYAHPLEEWRDRDYDWWKWSPESAVRAFSEDEIDSVVAWVGRGGALLLVAGNAPWAGAARELASRFDVQVRNVDTRSAHNSPPPENSDFEARALQFRQDKQLRQLARISQRFAAAGAAKGAL